MLDKRIKKFIPLIAVFLIFFVGFGIFWSRAPVLIVTDNAFNRLYGEQRLNRQRQRLSLQFFRRVIPVLVADTAGPDLIAIAVEAAHSNPWAVLFPYRYLDGARHYKENRPEVPVLVMTGRNSAPGGESPLYFVLTDVAEDIFRSGMAAAFFAGEKRALFLFDGYLAPRYKEIFTEGLRAGGNIAEPVFFSAALDFAVFTDIGCVVVAGPATRFLERNLDIPVLLFSWIDPAVSPRSVKIVFDDSPWALARQALKDFPPQAGEIRVPSAPTIIRNRIEENADFRRLKAIIQEKYEKK